MLRTCSLRSVSCLKETDKDSCVSPVPAGDGTDVVFKRDVRRGAVPLRGEATRGGTAERAVAPRAMECGEEDSDAVRRD